MFVKTFDTDLGQIVLFKPSEEAEPRLYFYFEVNEIVSFTVLAWHDNKDGWEKRQLVFDYVTAEQAELAIANKYNAIVEMGRQCFIKQQK